MEKCKKKRIFSNTHAFCTYYDVIVRRNARKQVFSQIRMRLYVLWCDWYHKKIFAKYRPSFFFIYSNREATVVKGLVTYGLGAD